MRVKPSGSDRVRSFYDQAGWTEQDGVTLDARLFWDRENGPIREALARLRQARIRAAIASAGVPVRLLEAGCGGNPAVAYTDLCSHYTGVDFSTTGLKVARRRLESTSVAFELHCADLCALPFRDGSFDAAYCAHVLYHLPEPQAQRAALREIARVLRPGGVAVIVSANPRPLLFPVRAARRLVADVPGVSAVANWLRPTPPLPYRPMSASWMRRVLSEFGDVEVRCHAIPSVWFGQHVTEHVGPGRMAWGAILAFERRWAANVVPLGTFFEMVLRRSVA